MSRCGLEEGAGQVPLHRHAGGGMTKRKGESLHVGAVVGRKTVEDGALETEGLVEVEEELAQESFKLDGIGRILL